MNYTKRIFDYKALAREYNIEPEALMRLVEDASKDFPNDEMMIELHVIRALRWLRHRSAA